MFGNGDLIEIDAAPYSAKARIRGIDSKEGGVKLHVAFEQGGYLPWSDDPIRVRRCADGGGPSFDARILHTSTATALIEILGQTPIDKLPRFNG
jgi:hypothetical protein